MVQCKRKVIVIVGPTATGKTKLSIELARILNGEVVSADSVQIYKNLNIGTAKPTATEMNKVMYHLIDFLSPDKNYSVAQYVTAANACIKKIILEGKIPIICGGTGLYVDSLLNNTEFTKAECNQSLRTELIQKGKKYGGQVLLNELSKFDNESCQRLHKNDLKRIARAIEIYYTTGKTMTEHIKSSHPCSFPYDYVMIGLNYKDRSILYSKINKRVEQMMALGLESEVRGLFKYKTALPATNSIGYKELFAYINGEIDLDTAVNLIKRNTRRYAKRQLTWFRRNEKINWIYIDLCDSFEDVLQQSLEKIFEYKTSNFISG